MSTFVVSGDKAPETFLGSLLGEGSEGIQELANQGKHEELIRAFIASPKAIALFDEDASKAEAVYMIIISVLIKLDSKTATSSAQSLVSSLTNASLKSSPELRLVLVAALFNALKDESHFETRSLVYADLLQFAVDMHLQSRVRPVLATINKWISTWKSEPALALRIYSTAVTCWSTSGMEKEAQEGRLQIMKLAKKHNLDVVQYASEAAKAALTSETTFTFDVLTSMPSFEALKSTHPLLHKLITLLQTGTIEEFNTFVASSRDTLEDAGLASYTSLFLSKLRTLIFCSTGTGTFGLKELQARLGASSVDEVETFVIDAVATGLIDARIDQDLSQVEIIRVTYRFLDTAAWKNIHERITAWRDQINNILNVHDQHAAHP